MNGKEIMHAIVTTIIDPVVLLLFSVGVFMFTLGLVQFLFKTDDPEAQKKGRQHMIWGIVGIFIMATVFGIIQIIISTFGLDNLSHFQY